MVITVLEARVTIENAEILATTYQHAVEHLDDGIVQTALIRNTKEPDLWQIVTYWESRETLEKMRHSGKIPRGVLVFRAAGAEPKLDMFDLIAHAKA